MTVQDNTNIVILFKITLNRMKSNRCIEISCIGWLILNMLLMPLFSSATPLSIHLTTLFIYQFSCLVFCDVSKAFDSVWLTGLLFKFLQHYINGSLLDWISDYLKDRSQRAVIRSCVSTLKSVNAGVPKCSVLERLLFLTYDIYMTAQENTNICIAVQNYIISHEEWQMHREILCRLVIIECVIDAFI